MPAVRSYTLVSWFTRAYSEIQYRWIRVLDIEARLQMISSIVICMTPLYSRRMYSEPAGASSILGLKKRHLRGNTMLRIGMSSSV